MEAVTVSSQRAEKAVPSAPRMGRSESESAAATLRAYLYATMRPLLSGVRQVALLDFPDHGNVGDSAIWLGERRILTDLGVRVAYTCTTRTYDAAALMRRVPNRLDAAILLHGGGNLGDLWAHHQQLREQVIRDFPDRRIIQLPQSVHFEDSRNLQRARRVFADHPALTVLVRDAASAAVAQEQLDVDTRLCPDAAFALELASPTTRPEFDLLWLLRSDRERAFDADLRSSTHVHAVRADWPTDPLRSSPKSMLGRRTQARLSRLGRQAVAGALASRSALVSDAALRALDRRAMRRVEGGLALLTSGRVVVTDRLHGHILSLLAGVPSIPLDNSYRKVSAFLDTWRTVVPLTEVAESPGEAFGRARTVLTPARPSSDARNRPPMTRTDDGL